MHKFFYLLLCLAALAACKTEQELTPEAKAFAQADMWYQTGDTVTDDKIDFFYVVSTEVLHSVDEMGEVSYRAMLTEDDRKAMDAEFAYVRRNFSHGSYNFFAPYYHQFNFDAIGLPAEDFADIYSDVAKEVCGAFDYYMANLNHGRRYALVGFSQGAMLLRDLLNHMNEQQYGQLVGAYMMGYRLAAEDIEQPHIVPAVDEMTPGVAVSYNSVMRADAAWDLVSKDAAMAINPVNWRTNSVSATFDYLGETLTASLDAASHLLIVTPPDPEPYHEWMHSNPAYVMAGVNEDCLHHWDLLFFSDAIKENIKVRNNHKK